jgi:hypothetical protein
MIVVFNATFSNISVILWQSVLIVVETRITGVWQVTDKLWVLEEKIFKNQPIRNKNCLWWPCLLTDRDEMSNSCF